MASVKFGERSGWRTEPVRASRVGLAAHAGDAFVARLLATGRVALDGAFEARPPRPSRGDAFPALEATAEAPAGEVWVFLARHPSGALTIHPAERRAATRRLEVRWQMRLVRTGAPRGLAGKAVRLFLLRVLAPLVDAVLPSLARAWESEAWARRGLAEGWKRVTRETLAEGRLAPAGTPALPPPPARSLLLLHGAFSHAAAAFEDLAEPGRRFDLLADALRRYEGRVFAFDHFTTSRTPEENARDLASALSGRDVLLDVVAHSRGGLVWRAAAAGGAFRPGRTVLVATPTRGTPLASAEKWERATQWVANLADLVPTGPLAFAAELVADALAWIAARALGELPGLSALAPGAPFLRALEEKPSPPFDALAADFSPAAWHQRLLDAGADAFFHEANDLVVPVASARAEATVERTFSGGTHHVNVFRKAAACEWIASRLWGDPTAAPRSGALRAATAAETAAGESRATEADATAAARGQRSPRRSGPRSAPSPAVDVTLLPGGPGEARVLVSFAGARILSTLRLRGGHDGERMRKVIAFHEKVLRHLEGSPRVPELPGPREAEDLGNLLFESLFPGEARRLWDLACGASEGRGLDLVLTSSVDWLSDKPWELVRDPARRAFLAVSDTRLLRGVFAATPGEAIPRRRGPLRILVALAQPLGAAPLSLEEETASVREGLAPLVTAGAARVDVLRAASPDALHRKLGDGRWDVVHFVGHGGFEGGTGFLLFEDGKGKERPLDADRVTRLFSGRGISLVFLNACETGRGGRADFLRGVAPALAAAGLPAVAANQYKVFDGAATAFARHLYFALGAGRPLGAAVREARVAVSVAPDASPVDFAVPVVYARSGALTLR